jgi:hypothetical protein
MGVDVGSVGSKYHWCDKDMALSVGKMNQPANLVLSGLDDYARVVWGMLCGFKLAATPEICHDARVLVALLTVVPNRNPMDFCDLVCAVCAQYGNGCLTEEEASIAEDECFDHTDYLDAKDTVRWRYIYETLLQTGRRCRVMSEETIASWEAHPYFTCAVPCFVINK